MDLRIEYTRTGDGVKIATAALGSGAPLILMPNTPWSHIRLEWSLLPEARRWYEALASVRRLILYDGRGGGLSGRDNLDFTVPSQIQDLQAVIDHWGLSEFALIGMGDSGPAAIVFTADNPARVSHLVLWCVATSPDQQAGEAEIEAAWAVLNNTDDWDYFAKMAANTALASSTEDLRMRFTEWARSATTREALLAAWTEQLQTDVTDSFPRIKAPTLVVHRAQVGAMSVSVSRGVAAKISNARLEIVEGSTWIPWGVEGDAAADLIYKYLGESRDSPASPPETAPVRTVLFTDLVGHTEMMARLGDDRGRDVLRTHERITREVLKASMGAEVKTMGDGFMASFGSVTKAVECAVELQRAFAANDGEPLNIRVGLNAGEPIEEDGDLFGATVIIAARIAARAEAGQILVADTVRGLCSGKGFLFSDHGEFVAKGFEEPVRVYEVKWRQ